MSDQEQPGASTDSAAADAAPEAELQTTSAELGAVTGEQAAPVDENTELLSLLPADDGTEEIEYDGEKHKIPAKLKEAFLRQADYTRKTQEVAEQRRSLEQQAAAQQQQAAFQQQNIAEVARLVSNNNVVQQIEQTVASEGGWQKLIAENPQRAMQLDQAKRDLQASSAQVANALTQKQQQQALIEQQATATRIQEGQRELARDIKGWSPDLATKLSDYGKSQGFPAEVLANVTQPQFVKVLNKARMWDELNAQRTAKNPPPQAAPPTRIAPKASTAVTDPDKLSEAEWKKWRETQIAAQRKKR
jgi:hypothetical protein